MSFYIIRVEMHEKNFDYRILHDVMRQLRCARQIKADDGTWYDLPEAEYVLQDSQAWAPAAVRDYITSDLDRRGWDYWILVSRWDSAAWRLQPSSRANALTGRLTGM